MIGEKFCAIKKVILNRRKEDMSIFDKFRPQPEGKSTEESDVQSSSQKESSVRPTSPNEGESLKWTELKGVHKEPRPVPENEFGRE